jgi:hypothetical protein
MPPVNTERSRRAGVAGRQTACLSANRGHRAGGQLRRRFAPRDKGAPQLGVDCPDFLSNGSALRAVGQMPIQLGGVLSFQFAVDPCIQLI